MSALPRPRRNALPRTVWLLGLASLLNDAASEMITPLLPLYLTVTLGAAPAALGLIEGCAAATSSLLMLYSGRLVDRGVPVRPLVLGGYGLSNLVRPLLALAGGWGTVLALRVADRVGKGVRTTPRDAVLSAAVHTDTRGRAFGLHRAMDHGGAVLGPLAAAGLLALGMSLPAVFVVSVLPGTLVLVALAYALPRQRPQPVAGVPLRLSWRGLDARVRSLIGASALLAFAAVPDAFLAVWAYGGGLPLVLIPLVWAAASALRALVVLPVGALSDRVGRLPVVAGGWLARVLLLAVMASPRHGPLAIWALFLAYAAASACTEGAERALIGDLAPVGQKAGAFGLYHLATGLAALPGAVLFGVIWQGLGREAAFALAAVLAAAGAAALVVPAARARPV